MRDISQLIGCRRANDLHTDFTAEVVASMLAEQGFDPDQLFIVRNGGSRRGVAKDIASVAVLANSPQSEELSMQIHTNRRSMYDTLPEGLFYRGDSAVRSKTKEQVLEEINKNRQEEFFIRLFFRLFEVESDRTLILIRLRELRFDKMYVHSDFVDSISAHWTILTLMDQPSAIFFIKILPLIHSIRRRFEEVSKAMSLILDVPVHVEPKSAKAKTAHENRCGKLGEMRLGQSFITVGTVVEPIEDLMITVGSMPAQKMELFLPGKPRMIILNYLAHLLISAKLDFKILFEVQEKGFRLDSSQRRYLGINTRLN